MMMEITLFCCPKRVSDACLENTCKTVRQTVGHLSDSRAIKAFKTGACGCLTKCPKVSDTSEIVTVCLAACPLDAPNQTPARRKVKTNTIEITETKVSATS